MTWTLQRFRTVDGLIMGGLPAVDFSWSRSVRDGSMSAPIQGLGSEEATGITLSLDALESVGVMDRSLAGWQDTLREAFLPKKYGIVASWDGIPIVAGPIADDVDVSSSDIEVSVGGITDILSRRFLVPEDFNSSMRYYWSGLSLGTIAKRIVQAVQNKPSGGLPITYDDDEASYRERTYWAYNVSNLSASYLLENISNVINGPDIDFRPYLRDQSHVAWHMHFGTENNPYIGQDALHDWEQGSPSVGNVAAKISTEFVAHRVYGVGDGEDEGTRVGRSDTTILQNWPFLEAVVSDSDWTSDELLKANTDATLSSMPLMQLSVQVRADGVTPLGLFWPGDLCNITVHTFPTLSPGTYQSRIQAMSGDSGSNVTLTLDPQIAEI